MENFYENLNVETTQNVDINYKMAGIGDRIVAHIVDMLILIIYLVIVMTVIGQTLSNTDLSRVVGVLLVIPAMFYHFICEVVFKGQSFGKMARNIRVIKVDGERPSLLDFFLRWLSGLIEIFVTYGVVALISILISNKSQRIGDMLGKTTVVKDGESIILEDTLFDELDDDYKPTFPQAKQLTEKEVEVLKELIDKNKRADHYDNVVDSNYKMMQYLTKKLDLDTKMRPEDLFNTILKDYNYLVGRIDMS